MSNLNSLKLIVKSLADVMDSDLGCYIVFNPNFPEMRFNFPVVVYFDFEYATCVSHITGEVFRAEYNDPDTFPHGLIQQIKNMRHTKSNKAEEFRASCFRSPKSLDYLLECIAKNIQ